MKKMFRRTLSIVAMAVFALAMNIVVFAQGTTMIAVSKSSPAVGDSVTVSVTASESGTVTVKYTSSMLNFVSCSASGYSASGNTVSFSGKAGDIVFNVGSSGTASIIVSSTSCSGSSTTLAIGGSGASSTDAAPQEQPAATTEVTEAEVQTETEEAPAEEPAETAPEVTAVPTSGGAGTLNADGGFDINGVSYVVSERFSDNEMPSGFSKKTIQIGSSTYSEPVSDNITLLYLKPADNIQGSGVFYLYNAESQTVSEFLMLDAANDLVIISSSDGAPSSAFTQSTLEVKGGTATVYTIDGSEFFYVYGTNKSGQTGWFVYDSSENTVSRMDESILSAASADGSVAEDGSGSVNDSVDVYVNKLDTYRKVIMALIVLCVIMVFILINTLLKSRDKDDDDFDGDVFASKPSKPARKLPRSIVFGSASKKDYDEEEEYDEEEYDEEYEEEELEEEEEEPSFSISESISSYEARRNSSLNMMDLNDL